MESEFTMPWPSIAKLLFGLWHSFGILRPGLDCLVTKDMATRLGLSSHQGFVQVALVAGHWRACFPEDGAEFD